jgi:hypothetical protein
MSPCKYSHSTKFANAISAYEKMKHATIPPQAFDTEGSVSRASVITIVFTFIAHSGLEGGVRSMTRVTSRIDWFANSAPR